MAFMAPPSEHMQHNGVISPYRQTSLPSLSTSLVSEFKDKFSVEARGSGSSLDPSQRPAMAAWPSSDQNSAMQGGSDSSNRGGGQANPGSSSSPELLQSSDWPDMVDTSLHFSKPIVSMMHPSHPSNGAPPIANPPPPPQHLQGSAGMLRNNNSWSNAMDIPTKAMAMDASKSSTLPLQGAGLATSHCLAQFSSDPGFAERAAKFSSFSNGTYNSQMAQPYLPEGKGIGRRSGDTDGKLSRTSSCSRISNHGCNADRAGAHPAVESKGPNPDHARDNADMELDHARDLESQMRHNDRMVDGAAMDGGRAISGGFDTGDELENSSCSEHARGGGKEGGIARSDSLGKRKNSPDRVKSKGGSSNMPPHGGRDAKLQDSEEATAKRQRSVESDMSKGKTSDRSCSENSGETSPPWMKESSKPPEPPKQDYIHVRARRGQATDSHSLAERVRREKISERMKFLQDLVPGCSKVTGKAVMLDEIINYVQSLQRQVEFLSMKLAAVNPRFDFNVDIFLAKEMQTQLSPPAMMVGPDMGMPPYGHHDRQGLMPMGGHPIEFRPHESAPSAGSQIRRTMSAPVTAPLSCLDVFGDTISQASSAWDGELQSVVNHMGFAQGRLGGLLQPQGLHCQLPAGHMKVEL